MTQTALMRLQDEIDAVRQEAFAEGYAAAMRAVREFSSRQPPVDLEKATRQPVQTSTMTFAELSQPRRLRRGTNAKLIESVLQSIAPRAARPTEIRDVLRRERGVALAFTSIRHALGQLEARRVAEQVAHSRSWRYLTDRGSADGNSP